MNFLLISSVTHNCELHLFSINNNILLLQKSEELIDNKDDVVSFLSNFLQKNNVSISDLDFIGAVVGPGSYTGLRVGLSLANTLSLALSIPLIGINLFEILVASLQEGSLLKAEKNNHKNLQVKTSNLKVVVLVAISNNKGGFFVQLFNDKSIPVSVIIDLAEEDFSNHLNGIDELHVITTSKNIDLQPFLQFNGKIFYKQLEINANLLKRAILEKHNTNNYSKNIPLEVLYIKPPKITLKAQKIIKDN